MSEFIEKQNDVFNYLYHLDVNDKVEKKNTGNITLSYLSWAWAWAKIKEKYPTAEYEIEKFENGLPYVVDPATGYMVFTKVTIEGKTHEMWLPVMDGANKAMKPEPYTYKVIKWTNGKRDGFTDKTVEQATMFDINKTIMRCLVKNLAMFGLGLYIYAGEDLPESEPATDEQLQEIRDLIAEMAKISGMKKSLKTWENEILAKKKYNKKFEDMTVDYYEIFKEYILEVITFFKEKAETMELEKKA